MVAKLWSRLEHELVFAQADAALLVVDADLTIRAVNAAYLAAAGRTREDLIGQQIFDAFPDNPDDPAADGVANLSASFETVLQTSRRDRMALQRYDVSSGRPGDAFVRRFWNLVNSPLRDEHGKTIGAVHQVQDVTVVVESVLEASPDPSSSAFDERWTALASALVHEVLAHADARTTVGQLQHALNSRVIIEQAKGVLVVTEGCPPDMAFELLRDLARATRRRVHEVAEEVVRRSAPTIGTQRPPLNGDRPAPR